MMIPERLPRFIDCRECDAPTCAGCNIYTLATALGQGKLDWMMDEKHCVHVPDRNKNKVTPLRWVENRTTIQCPECGREFDDEVCCYEGYGWPWLCCPKCGARMEATH